MVTGNIAADNTVRETYMSIFRRPRHRWLAGLVIATVVSLGSVKATDLNPAALIFKSPDQIPWIEGAGGSASAVLRGDPEKPGPYIILYRWHAAAVRTFIPMTGSSRSSPEPGGWARAPNTILTARFRCRPEVLSPILASRFITTAPRMRIASWKSLARDLLPPLPPR